MRREDVTFGIAVVGALLGIYNTLRAIWTGKTRLKISTSWITDFAEGGYRAFSVKVINKSPFEVTVDGISFLITGQDGHIPLSMHADPNYEIPRKIPARSAADFVMSERFHKLPEFKSISKLRVTTADGLTFHAACGDMVHSSLPEIVKISAKKHK